MRTRSRSDASTPLSVVAQREQTTVPPAGREAFPAGLEPMLATLATLPADGSGYGFEFKWDGIRALVFIDHGRIRLVSRRGNDVTSQYPELRALGAEFADRVVVLDAEIVALDEAQRPDFGLLQQRMNLQNARDVARRLQEIPVHLFLFDILYLDGETLLRRTYEDRRRILDGLQLSGPNWQTPPYWRAEGEATLEASRAMNLEGVVAKRLTSYYTPGHRSAHWLKVKNRHRQEFVVGGWTPGEGSRNSTFGSLLLGYYRDTPRGRELVYAGRVGSGFHDDLLRTLERRLQSLERTDSPFSMGAVDKNATYVEPRIVMDVEFAEWTHLGTLRQASFKGLREDKDARDVTLEVAIAPPPAVEGN